MHGPNLNELQVKLLILCMIIQNIMHFNIRSQTEFQGMAWYIHSLLDIMRIFALGTEYKIYLTAGIFDLFQIGLSGMIKILFNLNVMTVASNHLYFTVCEVLEKMEFKTLNLDLCSQCYLFSTPCFVSLFSQTQSCFHFVYLIVSPYNK